MIEGLLSSILGSGGGAGAAGAAGGAGGAGFLTGLLTNSRSKDPNLLLQSAEHGLSPGSGKLGALLKLLAGGGSL